ncbi:hypothetical protein [Allomuricauda sp. SCSIO 65647]|uniref:hypothetical protein n=1 Tax=Allomuricauda sp. SCSIO 65647 TaxID=2908843 RepID=UPI001F288509|nr:hypothetical protein [Muricauda sp. SCSIO 65647]UJH66374.1 hypothetical protein L0P89_10385 [Muricauda sp. SCSIO 65647]
MNSKKIIQWLLQGDVAIQYQVHRDLLHTEDIGLRHRIAQEGWGAQFLCNRKPDGHWGKKFYEPKWTSTHYTLLDLRNLCLPPDNPIARESIEIIIDSEKGPDGGVRPIGPTRASDVCLNGMFLNYASYFNTEETELKSVIDFLLHEHMADGGFNCRSNRSGAVHSSLHSTLSVLEGFTEYKRNGYSYRMAEVEKAIEASKEFVLVHQLFLSDRTGDIIDQRFLKLSYPRRWKYDVLSALDYFQYSRSQWDGRMRPAIDVLLKKRNKDGTWNMQAKHPGQTHFEMEKAGKPSRFNTLRALRVLNRFKVLAI